MDTSRFEELRSQFSKLTERWKASEDLNERLALIEEINAVLAEAQGLITRYLEKRGKG
jgi:uncharacterized coiled-coil protein SlyX